MIIRLSQENKQNLLARWYEWVNMFRAYFPEIPLDDGFITYWLQPTSGDMSDIDVNKVTEVLTGISKGLNSMANTCLSQITDSASNDLHYPRYTNLMYADNWLVTYTLSFFDTCKISAVPVAPVEAGYTATPLPENVTGASVPEGQVVAVLDGGNADVGAINSVQTDSEEPLSPSCAESTAIGDSVSEENGSDAVTAGSVYAPKGANTAESGVGMAEVTAGSVYAPKGVNTAEVVTTPEQDMGVIKSVAAEAPKPVNSAAWRILRKLATPHARVFITPEKEVKDPVVASVVAPVSVAPVIAPVADAPVKLKETQRPHEVGSDFVLVKVREELEALKREELRLESEITSLGSARDSALESALQNTRHSLSMLMREYEVYQAAINKEVPKSWYKYTGGASV